MAGIMVYLPRYSGQDSQELIRRGLGDLLDKSVSAIFTSILSSGPDGGGGKLVTFDSPYLPRTPVNIEMDSQAWREAPPDPDKPEEFPKGRYWLGYVKNERPTPAELQRTDLCDGEPVTLRDGQQWVVPIAEYLPQRLTVDPNTGSETREVSERHRCFVHWANSIFEMFLSEGFTASLKRDLVITIPRGLTFAALALAKNYRVNRDVVDLLELIEDYEAFEIAKVASGLSAAWRSVDQKKSTEPSSRSANESSTPSSTAEGFYGPNMYRPSTT